MKRVQRLARVVELVDTLDLKSSGHRGRTGSSPVPGTQVRASISRVGLNLSFHKLRFFFLTTIRFFLYMAAVYILYSRSIDKYYIGSCVNVEERLKEHVLDRYNNSFTSRANDWHLFYCIMDLEFSVARKIWVCDALCMKSEKSNRKK